MIIKLALGTIASGALALFAVPAAANETATATPFSGVIEASSVAETTSAETTSDSEFRQLFASWKEMDTSGRLSTNPAMPVSIPSRMPVAGVRLTSDYGMRNHPILRKRRRHNGVDLAGPTGTPVYATANGLVARADRFGTYGKYIQIEHGGQLQTRYAHLSGYAVSAGDRVQKGQLIGYIGSTGRSTGPHLHYEVRVAGQAVDPRPYMVTELAVSADGGGQGGPN